MTHTHTYSASASTTINAPAEKVWAALTRPELVKQYFFGTDLDTTWEVGSPIFFRGEWQGKPYEDKGMVLSFEPPTSLSFDYWSALSGREDQPEAYQVIRYDLEEIDGQTKVTITQSNVDSQENADHSVQNWQTVLDSMKQLVEAQAE